MLGTPPFATATPLETSPRVTLARPDRQMRSAKLDRPAGFFGWAREPSVHMPSRRLTFLISCAPALGRWFGPSSGIEVMPGNRGLRSPIVLILTEPHRGSMDLLSASADARCWLPAGTTLRARRTVRQSPACSASTKTAVRPGAWNRPGLLHPKGPCGAQGAETSGALRRQRAWLTDWQRRGAARNRPFGFYTGAGCSTRRRNASRFS